MTTTPATPTVIDVRDNTWTPYTQEGMYDRLIDWAQQHGLNPNLVYRVEIHETEATVRVHQLATDENGDPITDGKGYALREPYDVPLTSLPPAVEGAPA